MARKLRIESEAGVYHVINRGNYKYPLFRSAKTKLAFLKCLDEACTKTGWRVHAWCLMSNHYHLALSTPRANLVAGMCWLQGTFANRFNRFRGEHGHVFQDRYKSLLVEPGAGLGRVCHYIHLNPVRAGLCTARQLFRYDWTSLRWLQAAQVGPKWYDPRPALLHAGDLALTSAGSGKYLEYLAWLAENEPEMKRQQFDQMSRGWIIGTRDFGKAMVQEHRELAARGPQLADELNVIKETAWEEALQASLRAARRTDEELRSESKSADWKLRLAANLRRTTTATNRWLGTRLHLGARDEVSRKLSTWLRQQQ
jgi:putative transposase